MKTLFFVLILALSTTLNADPRIEIRDNFCHWPKELVDQDNEYFMAGCNGWVNVQDGKARGYARVVQNHDVQNIEPVVLLGVDSDEPCVMVDSNGVEYHAPYFNSTIIKQENRVIFFLRCAEGIAQ